MPPSVEANLLEAETKTENICNGNGFIKNDKDADLENDTDIKDDIYQYKVRTVQRNLEELISFPKPVRTELAIKEEARLEEKLKKRKPGIIWINTIALITLHILAVYNFFTLLPVAKLLTLAFNFLIGLLGGIGVTGGAHRLYAHKAYKAKPQLEIILLICYSIAGQNPLYDWVRDHRVHHKFSETDADPHNAKRGFFFAHCGWLMCKKHPEVLRKGMKIDMSDILTNPLVQFHQKYFIFLQFFFCFVLPTVVPVVLFNESWAVAFWFTATVRYCLSLNATWLVNSAAHLYGNKPFAKDIGPVQNRFVSLFALGEGWHNYHHVFPWDYKADELGPHSLNWTTYILDFFASIGWAYDLKQPSKELVKRTAEKMGDESHPVFRPKTCCD